MDSVAVQKLQNKQKVAGSFLTDTEASQCMYVSCFIVPVCQPLPNNTREGPSPQSCVPWAYTLAAAEERLTESTVFLWQEGSVFQQASIADE